ncbi:DDE Tnp4 domain-containing protein [Trichonephila clavipes]|nr:DDE Tnp4 domain-containing protein [Trichonephila clavipes]
MFYVVLPTPKMGQFQKIAQQYSIKWNFPNCIGAIDGKHVRIKAPKNSGSLFYNYKDYHSMVMLAVVDADCKFTAVDVGFYGREGDAGIFLKSEIGQRIKNNTFNVPPPKALTGTDTFVPHVIVGDEAFALHQNLMKPYPRLQSLHDASKAIYNYRLSRARRTTENAFGILCSYFRLFFPSNFNCSRNNRKNYNMCVHTAQHFASPENIGTHVFATAVEENVQQTVAAAMTIVTTCYIPFCSHPPLSRKPRLSIYTGDVLVTSSTVMLRTLKNGVPSLGNHSFTRYYEDISKSSVPDFYETCTHTHKTASLSFHTLF